MDNMNLNGIKNKRLKRIISLILHSSKTDEKIKFDINNHLLYIKRESLDKLSINSQKLIVSKCGELIAFIKKPSEIVQLSAIQQNGFAIEYIKEPTETAKINAILKSGMVLPYIKNPTENMKEMALKQNGFSIMFIEKPNLNFQLLAVSYNPACLRFIKNPDIKTVKLVEKMKKENEVYADFNLKVYGNLSHLINLKKSFSTER